MWCSMPACVQVHDTVHRSCHDGLMADEPVCQTKHCADSAHRPSWGCIPIGMPSSQSLQRPAESVVLQMVWLVMHRLCKWWSQRECGKPHQTPLWRPALDRLGCVSCVLEGHLQSHRTAVKHLAHLHHAPSYSNFRKRCCLQLQQLIVISRWSCRRLKKEDNLSIACNLCLMQREPGKERSELCRISISRS